MALGSSIVLETPPHPSSLQISEPAPQIPGNAVDITAATRFTNITNIPNKMSMSPTPVLSPAPLVLRPPQVTPIIRTPTPQSGASDGGAPDENSPGGSGTNTASDSWTPSDLLQRRQRGRSPTSKVFPPKLTTLLISPTPHTKYAHEMWVAKHKTSTRFEPYWKGLDDATKLVRVGPLGCLILSYI